jgi:hypothetical protein
LKTDQVVDEIEKSISLPHVANISNPHKSEEDMGTPIGIVEITKALHAIKRAALRDIEIQKADLLQPDSDVDADMDQHQNDWMITLFDTQSNPRISLNVQVGVQNILRLKGELLAVYQQSSAVVSKMFDEGVNSEQAAQNLITRLFAQDVEDRQI